MKSLVILVASGFCLVPALNVTAQTAQARLFCWSLRFDGASAISSVTGFGWQLNLTTISNLNGELSPNAPGSAYSHSSSARIFSEQDAAIYTNTLSLDVPTGGDFNGNGFPDFYESVRPVSTTSSGRLQGSPHFTNAPVQATWNRTAGSVIGTCAIRVPDPADTNMLLEFTHTFHLIEYTGPLEYTPGSNSVSGTVALARTGSPGQGLDGTLEFVKVMGDPGNQLALQATNLTNSASQLITMTGPATILRNQTLRTNYSGEIEFSDGDPSTAEPDYFIWQLSINDPNDSDLDTVPDFSDDLQTELPRKPSLAIARGTTNLVLTIRGDVGHVHRILGATSLLSANWTTNVSLALTNDPQTISLSLPAGSPRFWRALAE